jgi:hypothetical protein
VYRPGLPGFGQSTAPSSNRYTIAEHARVEDALIERPGLYEIRPMVQDWAVRSDGPTRPRGPCNSASAGGKRQVAIHASGSRGRESRRVVKGARRRSRPWG